MKKKFLLCTLVGFLLFSTASCSSDDSNTTEVEEVEVPNTLKDKFFDIEGATFKAGTIQGVKKMLLIKLMSTIL
ncbi:hypothetical protein QNH98_16180 [Myroides sp. mNGS23_01]|nr:hypothetical protein [Myroides sp. mNGS23_01]WHT38525.1 hypothetical protein QNH98_16180 [Myroides sp. mNGS23_01]